MAEMELDTPGARQTRPDPDPTVLTTANLLREIGNLRDAIKAQLEGTEKGLLARIVGIEKAVEVAHQDSVRIPTLLQSAIDNLRSLTWGRFDVADEKFNGIGTQFKERDTRVEQTAKASKEALDAALQAAKEAVGVQQQSNALAINKSEATTKEQISALGTLIQSNTKATDEKIDDLKVRLAVIEGLASGRSMQRIDYYNESHDKHQGQSNIIGWVVGAMGVIIALASLAVHMVK